MLKLNISKHCRLRNMPDSAAYLRTKGFSHWTSQALANQNKASISFYDLEMLCDVFNCTPNDLLEWVPGESIKDADTHPLAVLNSDKNVALTLSKLSYAQLKEVAKIVAGKDK